MGADLRGRWRRLTDDDEAERYPAEITFAEATYRGARHEGQGMIWWDAGTYALDDDRTLTLSTATDELVPYPCHVEGDRLTVTVADGHDVVFERTGPPPP